MKKILSLFAVRREERWLMLAALLLFLALNALELYSHYDYFMRGGIRGYWSIFAKTFRVSGYDCWTYIMLSYLRVYFETNRHPLLLTLLFPLYQINQWLMGATGANFAIWLMAAVCVFCAFYAFLFMYRILREVMELRRGDASLLTLMLFSFAHVMVPAMVPDHFIISLMLLLLTIYVVGSHLKADRPMRLWPSAVLLFLTAGITLTNGAKTILALWMANGRRFFRPLFILGAVVLPLALLGGIYAFQYRTYEVPQQQAVEKIVAKNMQKDSVGVMRRQAARSEWIGHHTGRPLSDLPLLNMTDVTTPRVPVIVENWFGESIQLHKDHLLEDVNFTRPIVVRYDSVLNYLVEALIVALFVLGVACGWRQRLMRMLLCWLAVDVLMHLVLGFGINEVYIMTAGWIFIIPLSIGCLMKRLAPRGQVVVRWTVAVLTVFLYGYNGTLLFRYMTSF